MVEYSPQKWNIISCEGKHSTGVVIIYIYRDISKKIKLIQRAYTQHWRKGGASVWETNRTHILHFPLLLLYFSVPALADCNLVVLTPVSVCSPSFNNMRLFWCAGSVWWWRLWSVNHSHPPSRINFKPHPVMFLLLPGEAHGNYSYRPLQLFQSHGLSDNRSHHDANKGKVSGLRAMFYSLSFLPCALEKSNY